jgi:hypothetical protein
MTLKKTTDLSIGFDVRVGGAEKIHGYKVHTSGIGVGAEDNELKITSTPMGANDSVLTLETDDDAGVATYTGDVDNTVFNRTVTIEINGQLYDLLARETPE